MVGQTFTRTFTTKGQKVTISRKITGEYNQFGRRLYVLQDPETKLSMEAVADDFDREFKVTGSTPFIHRKGYKGKHIAGAQKVS
ncbi:hypothetical protein [Chitinophaga sp. YIM B06452]|uniref:hypothetical protein n=1 Tax=Chitinophaga sp. YIM B06452 TaxID=3082158 RepID=UPI0031FEDB8B